MWLALDSGAKALCEVNSVKQCYSAGNFKILWDFTKDRVILTRPTKEKLFKGHLALRRARQALPLLNKLLGSKPRDHTAGFRVLVTETQSSK